ncbi:hypothetical protein [Abiotrophia defectiva]|uniref:hypothetical protein n=1 Tax=Abiotrophia defectiva TaxID=46125 RepID=UPI0028D68F5C|nr:hypothetical protein [Abiotrophia defectiva]
MSAWFHLLGRRQSAHTTHPDFTLRDEAKPGQDWSGAMIIVLNQSPIGTRPVLN